jgi:hypothetical protein
LHVLIAPAEDGPIEHVSGEIHKEQKRLYYQGERILYGTTACPFFRLPGMSKNAIMSPSQEQALLEGLQVRPLEKSELPRCNGYLDRRHYLKRLKPVGERLYYVATNAQDQWLAILVYSAAARHLKHRDHWIGWTPQQRERRLHLVVNQSRFLLLPKETVPNLATRGLRLSVERRSADWPAQYGHPVLVVETFVDPQHFCGTVYSAQGWEELGRTEGYGRQQRDYYVAHDQPKRLFVKALCPHACRSLQAEQLKPDLAKVERPARSRSRHTVAQIATFTEHFRKVPDYRGRIESYPLWTLLTILLLAVLCEAPRGQKDLAKFARRLTTAQRRALGVRRNDQGEYPAPSQSTWCRFFKHVEAAKVEEQLLAIQAQVRGPAPQDELVVLDGKEPKHGPGDSVLTAICAPSQYYLGSALVDQKTNEIPVLRDLCHKLELDGRLVAADALHTQDESARCLVLDVGADYLLTVKDNQPNVRKNIDQLLPAPPPGFSPSTHHGDPSPHGGVE